MLVKTSSLTTTKTVLGGPDVTATLWTSGLSIAPSSADHVSPPSVLRRTPSTSIPTQTLRRSSGSMAIPVTLGVPTAGHVSTTSHGRRSQLSPPSFDLNMAAGVGVPVPANIVSGSAGSVDRAHTQCWLSGESSSRHVWPASSLR